MHTQCTAANDDAVMLLAVQAAVAVATAALDDRHFDGGTPNSDATEFLRAQGDLTKEDLAQMLANEDVNNSVWAANRQANLCVKPDPDALEPKLGGGKRKLEEHTSPGGPSPSASNDTITPVP